MWCSPLSRKFCSHGAPVMAYTTTVEGKLGRKTKQKREDKSLGAKFLNSELELDFLCSSGTDNRRLTATEKKRQSGHAPPAAGRRCPK